MSLMNKEELLKKIGNLPNSFSWRKEPFIYYIPKDNIIEKLEILEGEFHISTFHYSLILFTEYIKDNELSEAQELIEIFENMLNYLDDGKVEEFWKFRKAFRFVFEMCKCQLSIMNNTIEEANRIFQCALEEVDFEERHTKAALMVTEAHFYINSNCKEYARIIDLLEDAIVLEPDQHFWYFLVGKIYSRRRRLTSRFTFEENREIQSLEKAYELKKNTKYAGFLAESLAEKANLVYWENRNTNSFRFHNKNQLISLCERCLYVIKEALELESKHEVSFNTRCGISLMKLPFPYRNMELAKKCLLIAKELKPNKLMVYEKLGQIYKTEHNLEEAIKHFKISASGGCYGSYMQLFNIQLEKNEKDMAEIISEIKKLLQMENFMRDPPVMNNIYIQLGWAQYLIENNLYEAVKSWEDPIKNNEKYPNVKNSKFFFNAFKKPANILEIVAEEILVSVQNRDFQNSEEKELYLRILEFFKEKYPEFIKKFPRKRRDVILKSYPELLKWTNVSPRNRSETDTLLNQQFKSLKL